jgi:hypothetical protein
VLGTREKDNSLAAVQLTVDLKPNLPGITLVYIVQQWLQIFFCFVLTKVASDR